MNITICGAWVEDYVKCPPSVDAGNAPCVNAVLTLPKPTPVAT